MHQSLYQLTAEPKLPSQAEMAAFDSLTISQTTSSPELMERAGKAAFEKLKSYGLLPENDETCVILCGPGNNGGDGLVIARHLLGSDTCKVLTIISASKKFSPEFELQAKKLKEAGGELMFFPGEAQSLETNGITVNKKQLAKYLKEAGLILDCLLGTGQKAAPRDSIKALIEALNESRGDCNDRLVSLDMPSGINGDTGEVYEPHVTASLTIAIELSKRGMVQYPARKVCGSITSITIGLITEGPCQFFMLTERVRSLLPLRAPDSHKGIFGRVLVVGGSKNMPGAPVLSCLGALNTGAGIVTMVDPGFEGGVCSPAEIIRDSVEPARHFSKEKHLEHLLKTAREYRVIVLGPGMGRHAETSAFVSDMLEHSKKGLPPLVLDADGLNILSEMLKSGRTPDLTNAVLTPHPGEAGRLLEISTEEVQKDRYSAAIRLHELTGATILLKGAATIVYGKGDAENAAGFVNCNGNPYMATPGTGDVLCGIVAALLAQGINHLESACLAAFLHGAAGDKVFLEKKGPVLASELARQISTVW